MSTNIYGEEVTDIHGNPVTDAPPSDVPAGVVQPETEGAAPAQDVGGTFDDLKEQYKEAQDVFKGKRGIVLKSLQDYGASPVATAAILGDIEQESSFNPTLDDHNDPTGAHGLLQVGNAMWKEFDSAAHAAGLKRDDPDYTYAQVPFMLDKFKAQHPERWKEMQTASSPADAIELFRGHPDWGYGIAGKRHAYADKFQSLLGNIPPGALVAGEVTDAATEFAKPPAAGNQTFGDLISAQEAQQKETPLKLDGSESIDYRKAEEEQAAPVSIPEEAEGAIPDLLKAPEDEEPQPSAPIAVASSRENPPPFVYPASPPLPGSLPTPMGPAELAPSQIQMIGNSIATTAKGMVPTSVEGAESMLTAMSSFNQDPQAWLAEAAKAGLSTAVNLRTIKDEPIGTQKWWDAFVPTAAQIMPMIGGVLGRTKAPVKGAITEEQAAAAVAREGLDIPEMERRWDKMSEAQREEQLRQYNPEEHTKNPANFKTASKSKFKDLHEDDQRAVAESFLESEVAKEGAEPDLQYSDWEKYSGTASAPSSTFGAGARARTELQRISPAALLRQKLRAAQKSGEAGFERGSKEAKEAGKAALKKAKLQAKLDAKADAREIRETLETADRWLDADIATVQDKLLKFARFLPLKERGKLLNAVSSALRKPGAWTRDPAVIRRRAEAVLNRMAEMVYDVNKKALTKEIEKGLQRIIDSPSVYHGNRKIARQMQKTFNAFKDKMSLDMLEAMRARMEEVEAMGRDLFQISKVIQAENTIAALRDIKQQGTLKADLPAQYLMPLEEANTFWKQWRENVKDVPNFLKHFNFTMDSMDWNFMRFDQRMSGALYRNLKLGIDIRFSEFLDSLDAYQQRRTAIKEKYKLTEQDYRKIAVHAELRQEGGLENLLASGFKKSEILKYQNEGALTKGQRALLKVDDQINRELYPLLRDTYEKHYNQEIGPSPPKYYPRIRDWDQYNSLSIEQGRFVQGNKAPRRTKTASGMTIERKKGAVTKNMVDSDLIMNKHLEDVLYTTQLGPEIARIAKIVRDDGFSEQVGSWGQKVFADYVDTLARNGGVENSRRFHVLDTVKKNVGAAQLGFRLTTAFLQPTALLMSVPYSTIRSMARGVTSILDRGKREWILKTFPEVRESIRGGRVDDPAYADYKGPGLSNKVARISMTPTRWLDGFARMSAAEAFYRDALEKRGIPFDRNALPHPEAVAEAQRMVRMTQAGPLPKDQAQALSRGAFSEKLLGRGNVSVDQTLLQFQSYIMNRWSLFKHGALQLGMAEKDIVAGSKVMSYIILATYVEQLGREGIANVLRATFGMGEQEASGVKKEQEKGLARTISEKAAIDLATSIPIVSNVQGMFRYDSSGVPVADTLTKVVKGVRSAVKGKKPETQMAGALRAAQAVGGLTGLPTGQIGDIMHRMILNHRRGGSSVGPYANDYAFPDVPDLPEVQYPDVPSPP